MQLYNVSVNVGGSVRTTVQKNMISAAHIMVLQAIHGTGAVEDITPTVMNKRPHKQERDYLSSTYNQKVVSALFGTHYDPRLPNRIEDVKDVVDVMESISDGSLIKGQAD